MTDPYRGQAELGRMVRAAARAAIHDDTAEPELERLNNILAGEKFVSDLADAGCMVTHWEV